LSHQTNPRRLETASLILASTSAYRHELLSRLGIPFRSVAPRFDETQLSRDGKTPRAVAEALARGKAASIALIEPGATVIGCDQLVALEGRILGKPGSLERAVEQLETLAGRTHELITALVVLSAGQSLRHTNVARLHMRALRRAEIERYVKHDRPVDCAGSYKLEQRGIVLFESIESEDHSAITGLPLIRLTGLLRTLGYAVP
jgi:septum formation protein